MSINTNFNANPYYDDYDEDKKFLRMLFKPGYAVQARELTQLQSILQKQTERFGNHIFKNGSVVTGGQFTIQEATYLKLDSTYAGSAITANNFIGATIVDNISTPTKRAEVIKVYDADSGTGDPKTLLVKQIFGTPFVSGNTILTYETSPTSANISTSGVGTGQTFSVTEGVFYYDGFFVKTDAQTVATSKYSNTTANTKIGFEITESTIQSTSDTSLLDPAQDASNYQAPGSDRFKINLVLSTRSLTSVDTTQFIELARVQKGVLTKDFKYPIYSVLEDTFARRTYDESGNYTVKTFNISLEDNSSNTANLDVILSPGKAYVYGYENETSSPTTIIVQKPRTTDNVTNKRISADYGYYVYSNTHFGTFPINSLQTVDIHCVPNSSINLTSTSTITNTKIGTARVKSIEFDSAANTSNASSYEYRTYLFDVSIGSITGNVNTANSSAITLGNLTAGYAYSSVTDAYKGAKLRITNGNGSDETPKIITGFTPATQTLALAESFVNTPANGTSQFSIDFEFNDAESIAAHSTLSCVAAANIDDRSKDFASTFDDAIISDSNLEPLLFKLGAEFVANNSIADLTYSYKRLYVNQAFSGNTLTISVNDSATETLPSAASSTEKLQNYQIVCTSSGGSYAKGDIISVDRLSSVSLGVNDITATLTVANSQSMTANVIATIQVSNQTQKSKTYITPNSTVQLYITGGTLTANVDSGAALVYDSDGQTTIAASAVVKTPDTDQSLYVTDVTEIINVYAFNGASVANTGYTDVTSYYTLNNGQKDSYYDHSSIRLKSGYSAPTGPLVVRYKRYKSSTGGGFFSVDSYSDYTVIPAYISPTTGTTYQLRDCLDFRAVRDDATGTYTSGTVTFNVGSTTTGPKVPENGSDIILDYDYYLPRIDKVIANKDGSFEVLKGVASLNPKEPLDKDNGMTLYILSNPPYVTNSSNVSVSYINNRRYTMRDIGAIDKRVENLEYYTSLSLLEQDTLNKQDLTILDSTNLPRFKNGLITDSFKGHSVADVTQSDYEASIDVNKLEARPTFNISAWTLTFDAANSSNYLQSGQFVTANGTSVAFIDQNSATKTINVNPFNVVNFLGKITLDPPSDIWIDKDKKADVLVNLGGDKDAWSLILTKSGAASSEYAYGSWTDIWTGTRTEVSEVSTSAALYEYTTVYKDVKSTRTGTGTSVSIDSIKTSIGDRVVDVSIIPYMRTVNVLFVGSDFKPDTTIYPFFDTTLVDKYVSRSNKFIFANNNLGYKTTIGAAESANIFNTTTATTNGTCRIIKTSNNSAFIISVVPTTAFNTSTMNLVGQTTGTSLKIVGYEHYTGNAASGGTNTIQLRVDASNSNNEILYANTANSNTIYIVSGTGVGQQRTLTSYNAATRTANVDSNWATTPDTTSIYRIGSLKTTEAGDIAGIFFLPTGLFRIGEKKFKLVDNLTGDLGSSATNGDASFFAQGLLQTTENTIVSTLAPTISRAGVTDTRVVSSVLSSSARVLATYGDPLAQTFLVSPNNYQLGIFVDKVRVCFKSKDTTIPVTLQLRTTVNGYPSSSTVYPYGSVTLTPDRVTITDSPDLDNAAKYTEFIFDTPIYVQPGEHSFVLQANSNKYEVYIAEIGKLDLVSGKQISSQPYGGSFFVSQNGSTWTADQNVDIMFRLFRKEFDVTNTVAAQFKLNYPSANTPYDLIHLITSQIILANTSLAYSFNSEKSTGGMTGFKSITQLTNYEMDDGSGRRVLNPTTGNNTFLLKATMSTIDPTVSPVLDISRFGFIAVENKINNLPLLNSGFVIATGGSAYSTNANVTVTVSGGGGSGATAAGILTSNVLTSVYLTAPGSGYTTSPTITIVDANTTPGTGATVTYNGENKKSGGNSLVRYLTRRVTLADGFDSGDLRVYTTAYKPSGSNIRVYFKILSKSDSDTFDNKNWQLMTELGNPNFSSTNKRDYRELTFAPGVSGTANNSVSYTSGSTSYSTFRTFAIKVVMSGTDTTDVPKIRDLRVIALPRG